jgi:dTDP-4-dehydrorhamnose reductase
LSTDYVLDAPEQTRLSEDLEPKPRSLYGESKLMGEQAVLEAGAVVIRLQWVYQPGSRGFFNRAMAAMTRGESVRLVTDQVGCPTPASLLAPALLRIANGGPVGLFHLATRGEASAWEWMQAGAAALGIPFVAEPALRVDFSGAHRPARSVLDSRKAEAAWGIRLPNWREALQTVVEEGDTMTEGVES